MHSRGWVFRLAPTTGSCGSRARLRISKGARRSCPDTWPKPSSTAPSTARIGNGKKDKIGQLDVGDATELTTPRIVIPDLCIPITHRLNLHVYVVLRPRINSNICRAQPCPGHPETLDFSLQQATPALQSRTWNSPPKRSEAGNPNQPALHS